MIQYNKYIVFLLLSFLIVGYTYSQETNNNSSELNFLSPNTESENSLLNLKKKDNPFLKKLENKNKKDFFPDANVKEKRPERFINSNDLYLSRLNRRETESNKNINKLFNERLNYEIKFHAYNNFQRDSKSNIF